jgi:hypothetical protein
MDIVCTRKLVTQMRLSDLAKWKYPNSLSCWYGNLFAAPRQRFVAAMESTTLVTVIFAAKGLTSPERIADALRATVAGYFSRRGWASLLGNRIAFDNHTPRFWAAADRTMLGSLVEMVRLASFDIEELTDDLEDVMDRTNDAPMSAIGMDAPEWILDKLAGKKEAN